MKVIDLLNKIANGEELPKKIYQHCEEFGNAIFELDRGTYWRKNFGGTDEVDFIAYQTTNTLNDEIDEIEIIEDTPKANDKINKLDYCEENTLSNLKETTYLSDRERQLIDSNFKTIKEKFDEIIDRLNGEEDESEL